MDYPKKTSAGVGLFVCFLLIKQTTKKKSALRDNFLRRSTLSGVVFYSVFSDFFRDFFFTFGFFSALRGRGVLRRC